MRSQKKRYQILLSLISGALITALLISGCSHPFPYQGSYTGNWSGQLTILGRTVPVGGTLSFTIDAKGVGSGTVTSSSGGAANATMTAQVDTNGNLNGNVSFHVGWYYL